MPFAYEATWKDGRAPWGWAKKPERAPRSGLCHLNEMLNWGHLFLLLWFLSMSAQTFSIAWHFQKESVEDLPASWPTFPFNAIRTTALPWVCTIPTRGNLEKEYSTLFSLLCLYPLCLPEESSAPNNEVKMLQKLMLHLLGTPLDRSHLLQAFSTISL